MITRPANLQKLFAPGSRALKPEIVEKYKTKSDPFRSYQSDTGTGQLDFGVLWDDDVIYTWDAPGEADAWYAMSSSDKGLHPEVMLPSFTAEESEKLKKIQTDVNAIMDPAIDKVVIGQATMADWDKAVQDCIKAGAQDLEKIYNEAEARWVGSRHPGDQTWKALSRGAMDRTKHTNPGRSCLLRANSCHSWLSIERNDHARLITNCYDQSLRPKLPSNASISTGRNMSGHIPITRPLHSTKADSTRLVQWR